MMMKKIASAVFVCCLTTLSSFGQSTSGTSGTVQGTAVDPSGAVVKGASVEITNPVSHYEQKTVTDSQGKFELDNIPFNNYNLTVAATGFQVNVQDLSVRTPVPLDVKAGMQLGTATTTVSVEEAGDLL